jgi:hypothetical protein
MALSAFDDKSSEPSEGEIRSALGKAYEVWEKLIDLVSEEIGSTSNHWGFTSKNTGWGLRIKIKDRVILYMTPQREKFFVSVALGEKAVTAARQAKLPESIMAAIDAAPKYTEGRGFRLLVNRSRQLPSLLKIARIKFEN